MCTDIIVRGYLPIRRCGDGVKVEGGREDERRAELRLF